jgi:hypothetical protein
MEGFSVVALDTVEGGVNAELYDPSSWMCSQGCVGIVLQLDIEKSIDFMTPRRPGKSRLCVKA